MDRGLMADRSRVGGRARVAAVDGERAHYELAAGNDPAPLIATYERFATLWPDDAGAGVGRGGPRGAR